jgi:hypothetical protein
MTVAMWSASASRREEAKKDSSLIWEGVEGNDNALC